MQILKVSPKGQITIPQNARQKSGDINQYLFEMHGKTIILRPIKIQIAEDDLKDFHALSESAFDFWDNSEDDIYQNYYQAQ